MDRLPFPTAHDELIRTAAELFGEADAHVASQMVEQLKARRARDAALLRAVRSTFASPEGQRTLDWLLQLAASYQEPGIDELLGETAGTRDVMAGYRAGMRDFPLLIGDAIAQANELETETETNDD